MINHKFRLWWVLSKIVHWTRTIEDEVHIDCARYVTIMITMTTDFINHVIT